MPQDPKEISQFKAWSFKKKTSLQQSPGRFLWKSALRIFQILPKNTCDGVSSFNAVANWRSATLIKRDSGADAWSDANFVKFSKALI